MNYGYWSKEGTESHIEAHRHLVTKLIEIMGNTSGQVLSVACGCGDEISTLLEYDFERIDGLEAVASQVQVASKKFQGQKRVGAIIQGDATNLPFPQESFDAVVCIDAAYHFNTRLGFFDECHRILRSNGKVGIVDLTIDWTGKPLLKFLFCSLIRKGFAIPF